MVSFEDETHQNTIESAWIASALHVTQYGDTCVLIQLRNDGFADFFGCNWIAIAINGAFSNDDYIQTLASITFLCESNED